MGHDTLHIVRRLEISEYKTGSLQGKVGRTRFHTEISMELILRNICLCMHGDREAKITVWNRIGIKRCSCVNLKRKTYLRCSNRRNLKQENWTLVFM